MSKQKSKNSLLASHGRTAQTSSARDGIMAMKYSMTEPAVPIYPLDDNLPQKTYPDFCPWEEDEAHDSKLNNSGYLNKGYFEAPLVSNEYFSARNLIQETLFLSSQNCTMILKELSLNLTKAYKTRNEVINKIRYSSNNFKIPTRVTLTAAKREAWLKDLANPDVPLQQVSTKLPHGIRNKVLIECMCSMNVPITRAIWFTKCALFSELSLLGRKFQSKQNAIPAAASSMLPSLAVFESRWLQEWTLQVADYLLKFSREMSFVNSEEKQASFQARLNYLLTFILTLYIECLLDRMTFMSAIINFLRDDLPFLYSDLPSLLEISRAEAGEDNVCEHLLLKKPMNYGQVLIGLTLIKMFWKDILREEHLCKTLSESLLLNYFLIEKIPANNAAGMRPQTTVTLLPSLKHDIQNLIASSVVALFANNSNSFIVPHFWVLIGDVLFRILNEEGGHYSALDQGELHAVLQLINYRNESLMLNMKYFPSETNTLPSSPAKSRKSSLITSKSALEYPNVSFGDADNTFSTRSSKDNLRFIDQLDCLKLNNNFTKLLTPRPSSAVEPDSWRIKLKIVVYWCVSSYRDMGPSSEKILIICNYIKRKVLQALTSKGSAQLKAEFENEILESIFSLAQERPEKIRMYNLYVLINELYQLKIISISSYLRKIIACGIFYRTLPANDEFATTFQRDPQMEFHLSILQNLPVLNNKQCDHILKKWTTRTSSFSDEFNHGIEILQNNVLELLHDKPSDSSDLFLEEITKKNVGVKFLLVNWLTSQIKSLISSSLKLIHLSASVIAKIYQFYACTNNLTVFFKVFIKMVLRNENKIIIFYLDTLYFISKLIIHHYTLVKFIAGNAYDSLSTAYELFKLLLLNYKDLLTRETDIYQFNPVWKFIEKCTRKSFREYEGTFESETKPEFKKLLFDKETADSPLKLHSLATKSNDNYSAETFKQDLNELLSADQNAVSAQDFKEANDKLSTLKFSFDTEAIEDDSKLQLQLISIFLTWLRNLSIVLDESELALYLLVVLCMRATKDSERVFSSSLSEFLLQSFSSEDHSYVGHLLLKLISLRLMLIYDLVTVLLECKSKSKKSEEVIDNLIFELIYGWDFSNVSLDAAQKLLLKMAQSDCMAEHGEEVFLITVNAIKGSSDLNQCKPFNEYSTGILQIIMSVLLGNRKGAILYLTQTLLLSTLSSLCAHLTCQPSVTAGISEMVHLARITNEFSLPITQLYLRAISLNGPPVVEKINSETLEILENLHFLFGPYNSFFGELFNYVKHDHKLVVFNYLQTFFLTQIQFEQVWDLHDAMVTEDVHYVSLKSNTEGIELMPIFKDFFEKFSGSAVEKNESYLELFNNLSNFLVKLLQLLENESVVQLEDRNLYDMVSIFLRLIIIHNATLTTMVAANDNGRFVFLRNLVALLNSRYFTNGHDKLQILLYDLLLLMKSSLTQILTVNPEIAASANAIDEKGAGAPSGMAFENRNSAALSAMSSILNLQEPTTNSPQLKKVRIPESAVTLDDEELYFSSDIGYVTESGLTLVASVNDPLTFSSPFSVPNERSAKPFQMKSMQLIEDTGNGLNDGCFNLSLFEAYTTKENPL